MSFPLAYLLTLAVEVPVVVGAGAAVGVGPWRRTLVAAVLANLATVPVLWFVVMPLLEPLAGWLAAVLVGETLVVAAEAAVYALRLRCGPLVAVAISLGANGLSVLVGLVVGAAAG